MKKIFLAMFLAVLMCGSAFAGLQDFKLINYSGQTIKSVYIKPSYRPKYEPQDAFTGRGLPLKSGDYVNLNFNPSRNTRVQYWDMVVFFLDDSYFYWNNLNLLKIYEVTIDGSGTIHYKTIR